MSRENLKSSFIDVEKLKARIAELKQIREELKAAQQKYRTQTCRLNKLLKEVENDG